MDIVSILNIYENGSAPSKGQNKQPEGELGAPRPRNLYLLKLEEDEECQELLDIKKLVNNEHEYSMGPKNITFRNLCLRYNVENPEGFLNWWVIYWGFDRAGAPWKSASQRPIITMHFGDNNLSQILTLNHFINVKCQAKRPLFNYYFHQNDKLYKKIWKNDLYRDWCMFGACGNSKYNRLNFNQWFNLVKLRRPRVITGAVRDNYEFHYLSTLFLSAAPARAFMALKLGPAVVFNDHFLRWLAIYSALFGGLQLLPLFGQVYLVAHGLKKSIASIRNLYTDDIEGNLPDYAGLSEHLEAFFEHIQSKFEAPPQDDPDDVDIDAILGSLSPLGDLTGHSDIPLNKSADINLDAMEARYGLAPINRELHIAREMAQVLPPKTAPYMQK